MSNQIAYPVCIRFGLHVAEAVPPEVEPNIDIDIGACCRFNGVPRYRVNGVETPDFDPTIPADLWAGGWRWWGSFLTQYDDGDPKGVFLTISGGETLADVWATARSVMAERARIAAEQAQLATGAAKAKRSTRRTPAGPRVPGTPTRAVSAPPSPAVVSEPLAMIGSGQLVLFS